MATVQSPVSEMLVIVKARELQRAMFAEMANDPQRATKHFLAAAHLDLVLADDYTDAGQKDKAFRSQLSAASCFWRAGETKRARALFNSLIKGFPGKAKLVKNAVAELEAKLV